MNELPIYLNATMRLVVPAFPNGVKPRLEVWVGGPDNLWEVLTKNPGEIRWYVAAHNKTLREGSNG